MAITDYNNKLKTSHDSCWGSNHTTVEVVSLQLLKNPDYILWKFRITTKEKVALQMKLMIPDYNNETFALQVWSFRIIQHLKSSYFSFWEGFVLLKLTISDYNSQLWRAVGCRYGINQIENESVQTGFSLLCFYLKNIGKQNRAALHYKSYYTWTV